MKAHAAVVAAALLVLALSAAAPAAAGTCPVSYQGSPLFGGVVAGCRGSCKPRSSEAARKCGAAGYPPAGSADIWGLCTKEQQAKSMAHAKKLGGGAAVTMSPCDLMPYLRGRTLWLLGDSFTKQTFRALQCFLLDFWDHTECEPSPDASAVQQLLKLPVQEGQAKCINLLGPQGGRVCFIHVVLGTSLVENKEVAAGGVLPLLRAKFAKPEDIFVVNYGWWHRKQPSWWNDFTPTLNALGRDYQKNKGQWPHLLYKEIPAVHPVNAATKTCLPMAGTAYLSNPKLNTNPPATSVLSKYGITTVPGFDVSVPLHDVHAGARLSAQVDCMHYCHPGVPEMGVWYLYEAFRNGAAGIKPLPASASQRTKCVPSYTAKFRYH